MFHVGQKVVCVESDSWTIQNGENAGAKNIGPRKHDVLNIGGIETFPQYGGDFLSFPNFNGVPKPSDTNWYPDTHFRPLESFTVPAFEEVQERVEILSPQTV